jgi:hypothetical protein
VNVDNPAAVMKRAGELEDQLGVIAQVLASHTEEEITLSNKLDFARYTLRENAEGSNADDRKAWVERGVAELPAEHPDEFESLTDEWIYHYAARKKQEILMDACKKRLSACQSVLKQFQEDSTPKYGAGQRNT